MTSRIVLSFITVCLILFVLGLSDYQEIFSSDKKITRDKITQMDPSLIKPVIKKVEKQSDKPKKITYEVVLDTPELKRAHELYTQTAQCMKCHGKFGEGNPSEEAPVIGGQHAWYTETQLNAFKTKERINEKMDEYLANLTPNDFKILAKYIEKMRVPKKAN